MSEIPGLRAQILANAKIMLRNPTNNSPAPAGLQAASSQSTLTSGGYYGNMDVVVFATDKEYTSALMVGLTPAIEGASAPTPEGSMRKLFTATAEMLGEFIPKLGAHQRAIHGGGPGGGGVFDEDLIAGEIRK